MDEAPVSLRIRTDLSGTSTQEYEIKYGQNNTCQGEVEWLDCSQPSTEVGLSGFSARSEEQGPSILSPALATGLTFLTAGAAWVIRRRMEA